MGPVGTCDITTIPFIPSRTMMTHPCSCSGWKLIWTCSRLSCSATWPSRAWRGCTVIRAPAVAAVTMMMTCPQPAAVAVAVAVEAAVAVAVAVAVEAAAGAAELTMRG